MKIPCLECEHTGCGVYHDKCEKYQEYKKENQRIRDERAEAVDIECILRKFKRNKNIARTPLNSPVKSRKR